MVKLRLRRMGKKKRPFYRIVAADSRAPRDGRFIELVGTYDPLEKPHKIDLQEDRIIYWLENGAQPTRTVKNLFQHKGLWLKWDLKKHGADDTKVAEEFAKWELLQAERIKRLEAEEAEKSKKKAKTKAKQAEEEAKAEEAAAAPAEEAAPVESAPVEETVEETKEAAPEVVEEKAEEKPAEEVKKEAAAQDPTEKAPKEEAEESKDKKE